jgi:hypothetical protein
MSKQRESGHWQNVANFERMIFNCRSYDATYQPANPALVLPALDLQLKRAEQCLDLVMQKQSECDKAINERRDAFRPLTKLASQVVNALAASAVTTPQLDHAKAILRKFYGKRAKPVATAASKTTADTSLSATTDVVLPKTISVSQRSFISRTEHFIRLLALVSAEPNYKPNEAHLSVAGLQAKLDSLNYHNEAVMNASHALAFARIERNRELYDAEKGLLTTAQAIKRYIRSVFGFASPECRQNRAIRFRKIGQR